MEGTMADYHPGITCSYCKMKPIKHTRYACLVCKNHNLCETCSSLKRVTGTHQSYHPTQKVLPMSQRAQQQVVADLNNAMLYCCPLCGDPGFTARSLVKHVERFHVVDRKLVHCPICIIYPESSRARSQQYDLLLHLYGGHPELIDASQCTICSSPVVRYGCLVCENYQICSKCRQEKSYSKDHRPYHPMQPIPLLTANRSNTEEHLVMCPYCGKDDYTALLLASHCNRQHGSDTMAVRCPICIVRRVSGGFGTLLNSKEPGQLHKHLQLAHNSTMDEECSICIEKIRATNCKNLSCGHSFHVKCIAQWLVGHRSCPICRKIVVLK